MGLAQSSLARHGIVGLVSVVLLAALGLQFARVRNASEGDLASPKAAGHLAKKVPAAITGWQAHEEPLGSTELLRGQVAAILNFDDYLYRVFTRGNFRVGVYVAYWKPGRMPVSRVVSHTPDRCWTENGWTCQEMRFNETWDIPPVGRLKPTQRRLFRAPDGSLENVAFWHVVNGEFFDFGSRFTAFTDPKMWLKNTIAYAVAGSDEQCFIRLTCNRPFEELKGDPGWEELIGALAKLGLGAR